VEPYGVLMVRVSCGRVVVSLELKFMPSDDSRSS
jgi:hypothetical protein